MKVLLDNCVPRPFERALAEHEVSHTSRLGRGSLQNGKLSDAAEAAGFEVLVTVDRNLPFPQSMSGRRIGLVVLSARSNDLRTLLPTAAEVLVALRDVEKGTVKMVTSQRGP